MNEELNVLPAWPDYLRQNVKDWYDLESSFKYNLPSSIY